MMISFFAIILLMIMIAGAAGVVMLIVLAIKHKRLGLLALAGGLAFLALLMVVGSFILWVSYVRQGQQSQMVATLATAPNWAGGPIHDAIRGTAAEGLVSGSAITHSGISVFRLLMFVGLAVLLVIIIFRRMHLSAAVCGHRRRWPLLLAIPLIALLLLGSFRYQEGRNYEGVTVPMPQFAQVATAHQQAMVAQQRALAEAQSQQLFARADIHDLMDKVDAPRIPLSPQPAASAPTAAVPSPPPPAATSAPSKPAHASEKKAAKTQNETNSADEAEAESDQTAEQATDSHSNAEQTPAKEKASVAQSKPAKKTSQKKKDSAPQEHPKTVAAPAVVAKEADQTGSKPPAWINNPPKRVGETWRDVLATDEYATLEECYRESDRLLLGATFEHVQTLIGKSDLSGRSADRPAIVVDGNGRILSTELQSVISYLGGLGITIDYIRSQIAKDESVVTTERSVGPMKKLYTLIEFSPAIDRELMWRWSNLEREKRFAMVGIGAGSIFGLLTLVFGLLKIDTWTKGYYTKRLFLGVPAAIIGGTVLMTIFVARHGRFF